MIRLQHRFARMGCNPCDVATLYDSSFFETYNLDHNKPVKSIRRSEYYTTFRVKMLNQTRLVETEGAVGGKDKIYREKSALAGKKQHYYSAQAHPQTIIQCISTDDIG